MSVMKVDIAEWIKHYLEPAEIIALSLYVPDAADKVCNLVNAELHRLAEDRVYVSAHGDEIVNKTLAELLDAKGCNAVAKILAALPKKDIVEVIKAHWLVTDAEMEEMINMDIGKGDGERDGEHRQA